MDDGVTAFAGLVVLPLIDELLAQFLTRGNFVVLTQPIGLTMNVCKVVGGVVQQKFEYLEELFPILLRRGGQLKLLEHRFGLKLDMGFIVQGHYKIISTKGSGAIYKLTVSPIHGLICPHVEG